MKFDSIYKSIMNEAEAKKVLKFFKNTKISNMSDILIKYKDYANDINRNDKGNYDITIYEK